MINLAAGRQAAELHCCTASPCSRSSFLEQQQQQQHHHQQQQQQQPATGSDSRYSCLLAAAAAATAYDRQGQLGRTPQTDDAASLLPRTQGEYNASTRYTRWWERKSPTCIRCPIWLSTVLEAPLKPPSR